MVALNIYLEFSCIIMSVKKTTFQKLQMLHLHKFHAKYTHKHMNSWNCGTKWFLTHYNGYL
jgi:hypothetical protein